MFGDWISEWTETRRRKLPPPWKLVLRGYVAGLLTAGALLCVLWLLASWNL